MRIKSIGRESLHGRQAFLICRCPWRRMTKEWMRGGWRRIFVMRRNSRKRTLVFLRWGRWTLKRHPLISNAQRAHQTASGASRRAMGAGTGTKTRMVTAAATANPATAAAMADPALATGMMRMRVSHRLLDKKTKACRMTKTPFSRSRSRQLRRSHWQSGGGGGRRRWLPQPRRLGRCERRVARQTPLRDETWERGMAAPG
mmetsp:Transcript_41831/g.112046  ORF Transcript_41831/g.112046 Transcript_41831/m.112046 type:complete len:201 (-) Transcript_41831:16-618(-)